MNEAQLKAVQDLYAEIDGLKAELAAVQGQGYKAAYAAVLKQREDLALELNSRKFTLQPIETAKKDGSWMMLFGPSGYRSTPPLRVHICQWQSAPTVPDGGYWRTIDSQWFTADGPEATHWAPLFELPEGFERGGA
jgi:hypothetical protein